ncbi:TonB-dependent siderophore receptor [Pseudomonas sp. LA21]|uniref:TonB-dependent siderophore receptor n=1 Tax=unclassified Pseudomonas TaxID=196821 RepID=UPI001FB5D12E|nr:TonB-dependent siderophore receptor [Pseudomonas sp. LA21]MCJ1885660.1 TonB-dependent siderophore receptor [Pseudomonas sp. LA21]
MPAVPTARQRPLSHALRIAALGLAASLPLLPCSSVLAASSAQHFSVPAGSLEDALNAYARQAGVLLSFDPTLTRGLGSQGLAGDYPVDTGFAVLLSGSGLSAEISADGSYRLQRSAIEGALEMNAQTITGEAEEDPSGPVRGYVAKRSLTATKTDTPIHETPQSISVVTRERMEAQAVHSVNEALRYTPGVSSYGSNNRSDWYTVIRGFSPTTYQDGLQLPNTINLASWMVDPYMLERVEVLRGPAGVLYGQGDPGGVINQVSKRPSPIASHELQVQYGSDARKQLGLDSTGALDDAGVWSYRVVMVGHEDDIRDTPWEDKRLALAPSLSWQPDEDTRLTVMASYLKDDTNAQDNFLPAVGTVEHSPYGRIRRSLFTGDKHFSRYEKEQYSLGYEFETRLSDVWQVRQNLRYAHLDLNDNMVYGVGTTGYWGMEGGDDRTLLRYAGIENPEYTRWTLDNQAQADFNTGWLRHTLLLGLDWQRQKTEDPQAYVLTTPLDLYGGPSYGPVDPSAFTPDDWTYTDQTQRQTGLYLQDQLHFDDHWVLSLGGRYDWASFTTDTRSTTSSSHASQKDEAFSGRVGLVYLADNGLAPYISYSEGFTPNAGADYYGKPFDPTKARQYEAGVKFQPTGSDSSVTAAVFEITQRDVVTPDPDPSHVNSNVQTGEVRSRGLELEGVASLSDALNLVATYTYQDVKITQANDASDGKTPVSIPTPRNLASLWADYTLRDGELKGLGFAAGARYNGRSPGAPDNSLNVPSYTLLDAAVHYETGPWRFAVNATNLTDREYIAGCYDATRCIYGNGRIVTGTATYRW